MKKYLKTLFIIPIYFLSYIVVFLVLLRLPDKVWGCQGFGYFGVAFVVPYYSIFISIPFALLVYILITYLPKKEPTRTLFRKIPSRLKVTYTYLVHKKLLKILFPLIILFLLIFIPLPCYQWKVICKVQKDCPSAGFKLCPSLYKSTIRYFSDRPTNGPPHTEVQITTSTPTPTKELIESWKTYRNEKYGFEFKYPSNWKILVTSYGNDVVEPNYQHGFTIHVSDNVPNPQTFISNLNNDPNYSIVITNPIKIGEYTTLHRTLNNKFSSDIQHDLWIENNQKVYNFTFVADDLKTTEVIHQILSTFKFLP